MFRNPVDAPLPTGPVTFYSEQAYLGDGVTATIPARSHAFVAFGLEPSVSVEAATERAEDEVRAVGLHGGLLEVDVRQIVRRRFEVGTTRSTGQRLFVFAEAEPGFAPRALPPGTVTTPAGYFLDAELPGTTTLELARRTVTTANVAADPSHPYVGALLAWLTPEPAQRATTQRLEAILARLEELRQAEARWQQDLEVQSAALEEQRQALSALRDAPANTELRRRIAAGVARLVEAVDTASRHRVEAHAESLALRQEWYATLRALTVSARTADAAR